MSRYKQQRDKGLCMCGKPLELREDGSMRTNCVRCRINNEKWRAGRKDKRSEYDRSNYEVKRRLHICVACKKEVEPGRALCKDHLEYHRAYNKTKRKAAKGEF
jgi:hypothetical protein